MKSLGFLQAVAALRRAIDYSKEMAKEGRDHPPTVSLEVAEEILHAAAILNKFSDWQLVPKEPTEDMNWAGWRAKDAVWSANSAEPMRDPANAYRAMLEAAPKFEELSAFEQMKVTLNEESIEVLARALASNHVSIYDDKEFQKEWVGANWPLFSPTASRAINDLWRPMSEARKDRTPYLLKFRNPVPRAMRQEYNGMQIVAHHPGLAEDGFDVGWSLAGPFGVGGWPDDWFDGWKPLDD